VKFRESKATNERDIIYALLGISSNAFQSDILFLDYRKSLQQVIQDTTSFLLGHTNQDNSLYKFLDRTLPEFLQSLDSLSSAVLGSASENGQEVIAKLLLATDGVDVDLKNNDGWTPLQRATQNGREAVVKLLLEHSAKVESKDNGGRTPLSNSAQNWHKAVVKLLLESLGMEHSKSVATSLSNTAFSQAHLTEINEHLQDLKMQMLEMNRSFPHWMDNVQSPFMTKATNALVEKAVQGALGSKEMKEMLHSLVTQALSTGSDVGGLDQNSMSTQQLPNEKDHSNRRMCRNTLTGVCDQEYVSQYTSIFGTLYYRSQIVRIGSEDDTYGEFDQKELETSWTLIPSTWLLGKGLSLWIARSTHGWKHHIEYFPIVPHDALIFRYSLEGNVEGVRHLLQQRLASPRDRDDQGFTALHVSFHKIERSEA
jgi:hypothetical protein